MALYSGIIGIVIPKETEPGIWVCNDPQEIPVKGKLLTSKLTASAEDKINSDSTSQNKINSDFTLQNKISIMPPKTLWENYMYIRYCTINGIKWEVSNVTLQYPRMELVIGGLWLNG